MPLFDFKCTECGFTDEYSTNKSLPKDMRPPDVCPKCGNGKMEKQFSTQGQSFDVVGGFEYEYGKKNRKAKQRADYLAGDAPSPY